MMNTVQDISVSKFQESDSEDLVENLWQIFHISAEHYRWMYRNNPSGPAHVWIARESRTGKFAGSSGFFPWKYICPDERVVCAVQFANVMTHPDFRRRGVFSEITRKAIGELSQSGFAFTFCFPNETAFPGHIKFGAKLLGNVIWLSRPLHWGNLIRMLISPPRIKASFDKLIRTNSDKSQIDSSVIFRELDQFDERFDTASWPVMKGRFRVRRDAAYMNWKYFDRPDRAHSLIVSEDNTRLTGYAVLTPSHKGTLTIMDLLAEDDRATEGLIRALTSIGIRNKFALLSFAALEGHPHIPILRRLGFIPRKRKLPLVIYPSIELGEQELRPEKWLITIGDQD